ncbi:hypothetical protein K8O68_18460 [Salipaludibacillus sp. CUR1]|uniref:hypothetical protein n=1 Tax=Salipaludibacillus sp. CUR1 TaxID=2820003 RepID=UPI001E3B2328|nr:hypothetical protein [Salipaludibacillus sp. CUR1]MCE7794366.1 hypothetical protein [Salipaludibacillus sp. CUR1]
MEIHNQQVNIQSNTTGRLVQLKTGDIYRANVESRISDREALISVRGQLVHAEFEGKVPEKDIINIQVRERTGEGVRVREITGEFQQANNRHSEHLSGNSQSAERVLREHGFHESGKALKEAVQRMMDRGVPLTKETVNDLKRYVESGRGTEQQRRHTIDMMVSKRLEPTRNQLQAIHASLHGRNSSAQLKEIARGVNTEMNGKGSAGTEVNRTPTSSGEFIRAVEQVQDSLREGRNVREAIEYLQQLTGRTGNEAVRELVNQTLREMLQLQATQGRAAAADRMQELARMLTGSSLKTEHGQQPVAASYNAVSSSGIKSAGQTVTGNWAALLQNEADINRVVETIREELPFLNIPADQMGSVNRLIEEAQERLNSGRELKARQLIVNSIEQIRSVLPPEQSARLEAGANSDIQQYIKNDILQTSGLSAKNVLITEVTERLAKATDQFKVFQKDVTKQLARIEVMVQQFRQQAVKQTRPMLENVIKQIDRAIMKSDWMLYADMKTERKMLGATSRLAEAKKILAKGNYQEARLIVREVQKSMQQINFKPSNQRVQHFLTQEQGWREQKTPAHRLAQHFDQTARGFTGHEGSSRQLFEGLRSMGFNRETELAQMLASGRDLSQRDQQQNMKALLLQMARGGEEEGSRQQQAQQALHNLTGQQLMSRTESQQNFQMVQFQIPLMLKGEAENLQIYVKSRNEGDHIDWENCQLYFHIDTKKLGPLGIGLNVVDRSLSISLKNDSANFSKIVEPLAQKYIENLKEVGFNVNGINSGPMSPAANGANQSEKKTDDVAIPVITKEGFDYKV